MPNVTTLHIEVEGDMGHGSRPQDIQRHAIYATFDAIKSIRSLLPAATTAELSAITTGTQNSANQFPRTCTASITLTGASAATVSAIHAHIDTLPGVSRI